MQRFIIVDPLTVNWTGHCAEYALRVMTSAQARGYKTILVANQSFDLKNEAVIPHYTVGDSFLSQFVELVA